MSPKVQDKLNQNYATAKMSGAAATSSHSLLSGDLPLRTTGQLADEQVKTAQEALEVAREWYRLGFGSKVEVMQ